MKLANQRTNVIPIHGDAKKPFEYEEVGRVDVIYMDVAQPDQPEILIKNAHVFLESGSIAMICVKSQSIDVTRRPDEIFREVEEKLSKDFEIIEKMKLEPYDKDHIFLVLKMK
jgi:fibrillarin-like pre-rRNA processing protein